MPSSDSLLVEEDEVLEGAVYAVNFTGAGVSVTVANGKATVTIAGGTGGSANGYFPSGWS